MLIQRKNIKMKKIIILLAILLFATMQGAFAQRTITGKVINAEDKLGMAGVYVVVKGTTTATTTDDNGNFMLNVPNDATIVVSFIGFKTVELPVENQTLFEIMLQTDANVLGDVVVSAARAIPPERAVVTALGIVRDKNTLTTSIQTVSRNELIRSGETNFMMAIGSGRVAGVNVYTDGNATVMEQFRGIKSLASGPRAPLFVIDGFPIRGRTVSTTWPPSASQTVDISEIISMIDPEDIESITIHKGPQAMYGSDGANGVVEITLKKR